MGPEDSLLGAGACAAFHNTLGFDGHTLLPAAQPPTLEDHVLSSVCDCLFSIFAALSSRNMRTCVDTASALRMCTESECSTRPNLRADPGPSRGKFQTR